MSRLALVLLATLLFTGCDSHGSDAGRGASSELGIYAPLKGFYAALAELQAGKRSRVAVLQIGDSHSANDSFSTRMRELMQARFGDGGRGMLPPAIPFRYYRPSGVSVTADGWQPLRSGTDAGPFGFAGLRQQATGPATVSIAADPPELARLSVAYLGQPGGGTLDITTSDGRTASVSTADRTLSAQRVTAPTGPATTSVEVRARGDGPVDLLSWTAEAPGPGVTWSNLGTIGAQVMLTARWEPAVLAWEAQQMQPALIVLAFGTNEGFRDATDLAAYPEQFRAAIAALRRAAPRATILIAGPLGGVRATGSGAGVPCPGEAGTQWSVPVNLPKVRHIERLVADSEHLFFWNWAATMGGDCEIVPWSQTDPPLAAKDHVHLLKPGYRQTAEALFETMMRGYDIYAAGGR